MPDPTSLLEPVLAVHAGIRAAVVKACEETALARLQGIVADGDGDTIYAIDRVSEDALLAGLEEIAAETPLCLVAEGLEGGSRTLPMGAREADCVWKVLVDPIDGTRGLMYQKRSAWILTGVAPARKGAATRLSDIVLAMQTEIPLVKQHLSDQVWAFRGGPVIARRHNRLTGQDQALTLAPTSATTIAHGYASVVRFFPGARDVLAAIDDEIAAVLAPAAPGKAACFEDQYASTGGQLYELMAGHDRFIADLRPLVGSGLCCHPYDLCTMLIARELGVVLTGADGGPLDAPFDLGTDVSWIGYANPALQAAIEPVLRATLRRRGL